MEKQLTEVELNSLVSLMADDDREVLEHVSSRIKQIGDSVIPLLEREWALHDESEVQERYLNMIHDLQFARLKRRLGEWKLLFNDDLMMGMWLVATYQYPNLDLSYLRNEIRVICEQVSYGIELTAHPYDKVNHLSYMLFERMRFRSNKEDFHHVNNSLINKVLETRRGNPISLCVVYMLVAQKLHFPVMGVNFPNLFLLTYKTDDSQFYINAFSKGIILQRGDITNYLKTLGVEPQASYYEPCGYVDIVLRVLRNMMTAFEQADDMDSFKEMKELISMMSHGDYSSSWMEEE
jgi:regulator of sirC expression with transglutaminase-like and TPR domain